MQIKRHFKASFSDRLGVIGGTLGLFTGISIISMVEAGFWFLKVPPLLKYSLIAKTIVLIAGNPKGNVSEHEALNPDLNVCLIFTSLDVYKIENCLLSLEIKHFKLPMDPSFQVPL